MMHVIRETCIAGAVIDRTIKGSYRHKGKRKQKKNPTPDAVVKNNMRLAIKKLARKINANFFPGDYHLTLTYAEELNRADSEKELKNYLARMKREFKKLGGECKYIAVTECKNHRTHHHVVMNYIDVDVVRRQWKQGMVRVTPLDRRRDYTKLAEYLIKETEKTFRDPSNSTKQRYSCSRNLVSPIIKREWVSENQLGADPKPLKGYEIVEDSVRRYEHPYTGLEHMEYRMVSTDYSPRLKAWRRGDAVKEEGYRRAEAMKQLEIDFTNERSEWS